MGKCHQWVWKAGSLRDEEDRQHRIPAEVSFRRGSEGDRSFSFSVSKQYWYLDIFDNTTSDNERGAEKVCDKVSLRLFNSAAEDDFRGF